MMAVVPDNKDSNAEMMEDWTDQATETSTATGKNGRREFLLGTTNAVFLSCSAAIAATLAFPKVSMAAEEGENAAVQTKSALIGATNSLLKDDGDMASNPLDKIDWNKPKKQNLNIEQMADAINDGLVENEWFVTGIGKPEYFSSKFKFSDPQVSLDSFEAYCRGVRKLFDQDTARCELICCSATSPTTITVLWRNSGKVNLGGGIELKPYLVTSTLEVDPNDNNLIISQVDEFDSDPVGLLLYQVPFLRSSAGQSAPPLETLKQNCDFKTCKMNK